jgi:hypothetical protein
MKDYEAKIRYKLLRSIASSKHRAQQLAKCVASLTISSRTRQRNVFIPPPKAKKRMGTPPTKTAKDMSPRTKKQFDDMKFLKEQKEKKKAKKKKQKKKGQSKSKTKESESEHLDSGDLPYESDTLSSNLSENNLVHYQMYHDNFNNPIQKRDKVRFQEQNIGRYVEKQMRKEEKAELKKDKLLEAVQFDDQKSIMGFSEISNIEDGEISDYDCDISYE